MISFWFETSCQIRWDGESVNLHPRVDICWMLTSPSSIWPWSGMPKVRLYDTFLGGLRQLLNYESLWCILFQGHVPPRVTSRHCQRQGLEHLLWDSCGQWRLWCHAPTASLWIPLVFPLWPGAQFLWQCISVAFWIGSCWRMLLACILSYHGSQLCCRGIRVDLKGLWKVQID